MRSDWSQIALVVIGILVTALFGAFFYRELFPEYKIYQDDYIALEKFRATYTNQPLPPFQTGIKQIVIERSDKGPSTVDRCISCHVALQIPYFSPTKIANDLNGNIIYDPNGKPVQIPNEDYIWLKLDTKIAELKDPQVIEHLKSQGQNSEVEARLKEAEYYESLKTTVVGENVYDVTKALMMHPLIGHETRPFEYHPLEDYGCTSCHSGNGRGLATDRAHGPVFDGQYETEYEGAVPQFTESDPKNDPRFAHMFNNKPGSRLIFQTTPILIGPLIQSQCAQCHLNSAVKLDKVADTTSSLTQEQEKKVQLLMTAYENNKQSLIDLLKVRQMVMTDGYAKTLETLNSQSSDYRLPEQDLMHIESQMQYLKDKGNQVNVLAALNRDLGHLLGSQAIIDKADEIYLSKGIPGLEVYLRQVQTSQQANGTLFKAAESLDYNQSLQQHAKEMRESIETSLGNQKVVSTLETEVDELTRNYQRGKELFLSQACYACHKISNFARGGVGPELTNIGDSYPWYIKQSIVWPQADLRTSTMPNMRLDHVELQDLMAFLLAQKGSSPAIAKTAYQADLQAWEGGRKLPWEKPVTPSQMFDVKFAMTVFATEGCAACHRLEGFESNVGFKIEKESPSFEALYEEQNWFKKLFPEIIHIGQYDEELPGSSIVMQLETNAKEIDERIISDVRQDSLLEEIERKHPEALEALYSNFRYAFRYKDDQAWHDRVHRVLMMYIQTYGLGRLIGPHLNWSGIYRSDQWLMEHFRNPGSHIPRSIMPVMPFDDTKFYALTNMLDHLAIKNRQASRKIWEQHGFDPQVAFKIHCMQCHGMTLNGNGVIAEWLYPIPKNLRNPDFLRNLTKEEVIHSIQHGVKGTPMPPWGEVAADKSPEIKKLVGDIPVLTEAEIHYLVDWLFSSLSGGEIYEKTTVPKWQYSPEDVIEELKKEGGTLIPEKKNPLSYLPRGENYYASLEPKVYPQRTSQTVDDIFDQNNGHTYIKKKYYTTLNIQEGKQFFLLNCAVCHGTEGDGSGPRSEVLKEAKPRMFTDLDWINTHDDLYLLRSIKYGVPGTAMTPWGDQTNSLQRLQLVIFIRSLTHEQEQREKLTELLYQTFETQQIVIDNSRIAYSKKLEELQKQANDRAQKQAESAYQHNENEAIKFYQENLEINKQLDEIKKEDQKLKDLQTLIKNKRGLYYDLGATLISKDVSDQLMDQFYEIIRLTSDRNEKVHKILDKMIAELDLSIASLEEERQTIEGKIASAKRREELAANGANLNTYKKLKAKMIADIENALRMDEKEEQLKKEISEQKT